MVKVRCFERDLRLLARKALSTDPMDRNERMDCKDCIEPPRFSCGLSRDLIIN